MDGMERPSTQAPPTFRPQGTQARGVADKSEHPVKTPLARGNSTAQTARPFCKVCSVRHGKELWDGFCCCTGHVSFAFTMPGPRNTTEAPKTRQKAPVSPPARKASR
jgi:hypothetical protein